MTPPEPAVAQRPAGTLPQHNSNTLHCAEPCLGGGSETADQRRSTLTLAGAVTRLLLRDHAMKDVVSAGAVAALLLVPNLAFAQDAGAPGVTFARDIAPILQEKCQECHRKGTAAPMSLVTYEETRPWA